MLRAPRPCRTDLALLKNCCDRCHHDYRQLHHYPIPVSIHCHCTTRTDYSTIISVASVIAVTMHCHLPALSHFPTVTASLSPLSQQTFTVCLRCRHWTTEHSHQLTRQHWHHMHSHQHIEKMRLEKMKFCRKLMSCYI